MFDARFFSKENIRNRLIRRSAELWGIDEGELSNFDPLVRLLLESTSVEIEKIGREIQGSETRLMERIAEVLCPGAVNLPQPARAIAQATPMETRSNIGPETLLVLRKTNPAKGEPKEIFFSPASTLPIVKAAITVMATPFALYENDKNGRTLSGEAKQAMEGEKWVWFGIESSPSLNGWEDFRFFFDWRDEQNKELYTRFLSLSKWHDYKGAVHARQGYGVDVAAGEDDAVLPFFAKQFITLSDSGSIDRKNPEPEKIPADLERLFGPSATKGMKAARWIKMELPASFPVHGFDSMTVSLNAFPVLNRRLNKFTYRLQPGLNGIPLTSEEAFFKIHSVINQQGKVFKASESAEEQDIAGLGSYSVRQQGMGRFDKRDARSLLYNLQELLRDEQMAFSALGEEYLAALLREMSQNMARLDQKLGTKKTNETAAHPFLVIKTSEKSDSVFVSYWTTLGEAANGLTTGSRLLPYSSSFLNSNEIFLLTKPLGGRGALSSSEYVQELRKNVQSRGRLVTREDIRVFCLTELGNRARKVEVGNHYLRSNLPEEGFMSCTQIKVFADKSISGQDEWPVLVHGLKTKIESLSSQAVPVDILIV